MNLINTITTRSKVKSFSWSYSKIKNFETCPKRYYNVDVAKVFKEEESDQLLYGNALHGALAKAIAGKEPLPKPFEKMQVWVDKVRDNPTGEAVIEVEQKFAITKDYGPTGYFDNDAWYRGIGDVVKKLGPVANVKDWKTGKIIEDGVQLALMAQCVFAHHPEIQKIRTEFVWLKEDAITRADFTREDMVGVWAGLLPRVTLLENAHKAMDFPAKSGGLCRRYCPVSSCAHHGV